MYTCILYTSLITFENPMLKYYLLASFRNIRKERIFSLINILGLTFGVASFLLIIQFTSYELSYDNYHHNKDRIYRLKLNRFNKGELTTQWASGCAGIGQALQDNFSEVADIVKFKSVDAVVSYEDTRFRETSMYFATPSVFTTFTIPIIKGNPASILEEPGSIAISASMAKKYFGEEDPIGKILKVNDQREAEVSGVFQDLPENTHMKFDFLIPWSRLVEIYDDDVNTAWQWDGFMTFVLLEDQVNYLDFQAKLPAFVEEQVGEELRQYDADMEFILQPVEDIYLTSNFIGEFKINGDKQSVNFLMIIAVFIIVVAWINYINLSTSKSLDRAKEVGVRKVMGSSKEQLIKQFIIESLITNILAVGLAFLIVLLLWPSFQNFIGKTIALSILSESTFWMALLGLILLGTLLSGLYPAFVLSSFKPATVLKGKFNASRGGSLLRKGLVVFQFVISMFLVVGTLTVFNQIHYMQNQDLGLSIDQTLVIRSPHITDSTYSDKRQVFKNEILRNSEIETMAISSVVPGTGANWNAGGVRRLGQEEAEGNQYRIMVIDGEFIDAYGMEMAAGRAFDDDRVNETGNVIFNESAIELMGFESVEEALDEPIHFWGDTFNIVGVLKNYHQESLKESFEPLIFRYQPNWGDYFSLKISTTDLSQVIDKTQEEFEATFPGNPFEYFFLDEHFDKQYKADQQFGKVFTMFSILAIIIACLGLFGLSSFATSKRTKEIGVRKVLGATVPGIFTLLTRDFAYLIGIAVFIASPISYLVMDRWLMNFAYAINIQWWIFLVPALALMMIAVFAVSYYAIKAAIVNPANSLRYE
jgi:putative ABC transport system permease protein